MTRFAKNQKGKLSIEQIAWIVIALSIVVLGAAVAFMIMGNKTDDGQQIMRQNTLVCPADTSSVDARQYIPEGVPLSLVNAGGALAGSSYTIIPNSPYTDLDSDGSTAEFVCVRNVSGF